MNARAEDVPAVTTSTKHPWQGSRIIFRIFRAFRGLWSCPSASPAGTMSPRTESVWRN